MNNLDVLNLAKIDPSGMYHDIANSGISFLDGFESLDKLPIPPHYIKCRRLVISGMGGSGMAGHLLKSLISPLARVPIEVVNDYQIPGFVDNETVLVGISYSGNTEETIETYIESYKKGARLISLGSGGKLEELSRKYGAPFYRTSATICGQPRLGTIKFFGALISLVNRLGYFEVKDSEIIQARTVLDEMITQSWGATVPTEDNLAKKIAREAFDKIPVIWGADHLTAVAHRFKGDFNENSKVLSYFEPLPEMNHKSLVGTEFPKPLIKNILHLLLKSQFGHEKNRLRIEKTAAILKKRKFATEIINFSECPTPLAEILCGLTLSSFISFYLASLYGEDPTPVAVIEDFKKSLN